MNDIKTESSNSNSDAGLPEFIQAMLRVGKILLKDNWEMREVSPRRISKTMERHRKNMPWVYKPKEICEQWEYYNCYLEGAGLKIEASEVPIHYRGARHYQFTFTRTSQIQSSE
jgi:hypothetical protein